MYSQVQLSKQFVAADVPKAEKDAHQHGIVNHSKQQPGKAMYMKRFEIMFVDLFCRPFVLPGGVQPAGNKVPSKTNVTMVFSEEVRVKEQGKQWKTL